MCDMSVHLNDEACLLPSVRNPFREGEINPVYRSDHDEITHVMK